MSKRKTRSVIDSNEIVQSKKLGYKKVLVLKEDLLKNDDNKDLDIITLKHPSTEESTYFLISSDQNKIYEFIKYDETFRSWFIDNQVCSDGRIYFLTQFDPLFIIINYVYNNCKKHAVPMDQLFKDESFPDIKRLIKLTNKDQLNLICDCKPFDDSFALKYNEDKVLKWLKRKCYRLIDCLKTERVYVGQGAVSATYIKSEKLEGSKDFGEYERYAFGMISDYLNEYFINKLQEFLNIPDAISLNSTKKRKSPLAEIDLGKNKKIKIEKEETINSSLIDTDDGSEDQHSNSFNEKSNVERKTSTKEKALAKAAKGSKSIASFFTKK